MTRYPRRRKGASHAARALPPDDERPEVARDPQSGELVRRTYEDPQMDADIPRDHGTGDAIGDADAGELADAAKADGATFVRGSSRARAHVRHAPPAVRKEGTLGLSEETVALPGAPTRVIVGARGGVEELPAQYVVCEAIALVTSHDPRTFSPNADYPKGVQERRYESDRYEQLKVSQNAARMVPAFLITDNPDSVNGPPVVTRERIVLGGNSRAMSLRLAYEEGAAEAYRALLVERAKVFGIDPKSLDGWTAPVLVRVVELDAARWQDMSRRLNEAQTQEKDVNADAVSLSHRLSPEALAQLGADVDPEETLNAYLASTRARSFVRALYHDGVITQQTAGRLLVGSDLTEEGRSVVARVLVARVVGDATTIERMGAARRDVIARCVPGLLRARAVGHDLGPAMRAALDDLTDAEARGMTVSDMKAQGSMFELTAARSRTQEAIELRDLLAGKPAIAVRALRRFSALAADSPAGQNALFGESPTTAALLHDAIAAEKEK